MFLVDVDGTIAIKGDRGQFEWDKVYLDRPNWPVIHAVRALRLYGFHLIFMSGRSDVCREATEAWIGAHLVLPHGVIQLYMRKDGDFRKDSIVKRELYEAHIKDNYVVSAVWDDRQQVVDMWRELGLTCFQVAPGNF